jgi:arginyl-tRNA synthetase
MDIFQKYREQIVIICGIIFPSLEEKSFSAITAEPPKDTTHGDIASNAAMVLAKPLGKNPRVVAEEILEELKKNKNIESAEIAGAGFINIKLKNSEWFNVVGEILNNPENFAKNNIGLGEKINVEYVSANPTGPMHIGHARNAVIGDVLARILAANGYNVTKEYYINDAGAQVNVLAESTLLRYKEALGQHIGDIPQGLYPGEYLIDVAQKLKAIYGDSLLSDKDALPKIKKFAITEMMLMIKNDLAMLGVSHDVFTSEAELHKNKALEKSVEYLNSLGLVYRGILEPPKGKTPDDWEAREQLLFKATEFGDDVDRPLQKSDGSYTYFSGDIAYHLDKYNRGFNKMVIALGADHGGYVKRLKAVVKALSGGKANIDVILSQLVNLVEDGAPVKMSKRAGNFVTMNDVITRVGAGVVRFIMLTRKADATIDFDLKKVLETTKENPVFYVQYAHARICSALRSADEQKISLDKNADISVLSHPKELALIKKLAEYPRVLRSAANTMEPHKIPIYLYDLSAEFHQLWNLGKEEGLKFIDISNPVATKARLKLLLATKSVLKMGLDLVGVDAMERM